MDTSVDDDHDPDVSCVLPNVSPKVVLQAIITSNNYLLQHEKKIYHMQCINLVHINLYFRWALNDLFEKLLFYAFNEIINLVHWPESGPKSFYYLSEVINLSYIHLSRFYCIY